MLLAHAPAPYIAKYLLIYSNVINNNIYMQTKYKTIISSMRNIEPSNKQTQR